LALFKKGDTSLWKAARLARVSLREMPCCAAAQGLRASGVHTSGRVIPGLYVAGETMGELYYYNPLLPFGHCCAAITSGWILGTDRSWSVASARAASRQERSRTSRDPSKAPMPSDGYSYFQEKCEQTYSQK
jgi:hypothetical protein